MVGVVVAVGVGVVVAVAVGVVVGVVVAVGVVVGVVVGVGVGVDMKFLCKFASLRLVVDAGTWFDARAYASRLYGVEGLEVERTDDEAKADVILVWNGSDAGTKPNRRLEVTEVKQVRSGMARRSPVQKSR